MNEQDMFIQSLPLIKSDLPQLSAVKSCAMIGCGYGRLDLECVGVGGCCPNVMEIAAVEPDEDQLANLKTRVAQLLPSVSVDYYQETAQTWNGADKLFDAVLLFECMPFVSGSERPALFKKLLNNVVAPGGYVMFFVQYQQSFSNPVNVIDQILSEMITRLGLPLLEETDRARISEMMTSAGFQLCYDLPIECEMRFDPLDDNFLSTFVFWSEGTVSLDQVRKVAVEVFGDGKLVPYTMSFLVLRKP